MGYFSLLSGHFSGAVQKWMRGTFGRLISSSWNTFWSGNYMVGWTIQVSRYIHSHNIFIIILWAVEGISLRPVRHILPIIPYLDIFWSSPRLGLNSLNHIFSRSINSSSGYLWKNWDHGWVEKTTAYNIPMWCRHFLQQTICGEHPLKATWTNIPILNQFPDFH